MTHLSIPATDPGADDLRGLLGREHGLLAAVLEDVIDALAAGNLDWATRCFWVLHRGLDGQLRMEEQQILAAFAQAEPADARSLLDEHTLIRERLSSLVSGLDLHVARESELRHLGRILRAHAEHEDAHAYRWADANLTAPVRAAMQRRVRERITSTTERLRALWGVQKSA
jgi:hypothetical protein